MLRVQIEKCVILNAPPTESAERQRTAAIANQGYGYGYDSRAVNQPATPSAQLIFIFDLLFCFPHWGNSCSDGLVNLSYRSENLLFPQAKQQQRTGWRLLLHHYCEKCWLRGWGDFEQHKFESIRILIWISMVLRLHPKSADTASVRSHTDWYALQQLEDVAMLIWGFIVALKFIINRLTSYRLLYDWSMINWLASMLSTMIHWKDGDVRMDGWMQARMAGWMHEWMNEWRFCSEYWMTANSCHPYTDGVLGPVPVWCPFIWFSVLAHIQLKLSGWMANGCWRRWYDGWLELNWLPCLEQALLHSGAN